MPPFNLKIRPSEKTDVRRREFIMLINIPPPRGRLREPQQADRRVLGVPGKLANANTNNRKEAPARSSMGLTSMQPSLS
jgi:hypothetical protein